MVALAPRLSGPLALHQLVGEGLKATKTGITFSPRKSIPDDLVERLARASRKDAGANGAACLSRKPNSYQRTEGTPGESLCAVSQGLPLPVTEGSHGPQRCSGSDRCWTMAQGSGDVVDDTAGHVGAGPRTSLLRFSGSPIAGCLADLRQAKNRSRYSRSPGSSGARCMVSARSQRSWVGVDAQFLDEFAHQSTDGVLCAVEASGG